MGGLRKTVRWRGSRDLTETPESGEFSFKNNESTGIVILEGPYETCLKNRPLRGSEIKGYAGFIVDTVGLKRKAGSIGTLTITLSADPEAPVAQDIRPEVKHEVEWVQIEKALITHPRYVYEGATQGPKELDLEARVAIKFWEDCPNARLKAAFKYFEDPNKIKEEDAKTLTANAQDYATKILKGEDSYIIFIPVCRRTTTTMNEPVTSKAGHREDPPSGKFPKALIDAWKWLKTADRLSQSGKSSKWEQIEEWTGANLWDTDLYST